MLSTCQQRNGREISMSEESRFTMYTLPGPSILEVSQVEKIGEELARLIDQRKGIWLAVDFTQVRVIASMALGMLVAVRKMVKETNGRMVLFGATGEAIQRVMSVTRLNTLFPIVDTKEQLADAFAQIPNMPFWRDPPPAT